MKKNNFTEWFLLISFLLIVIVDIVLVILKMNTISKVGLMWSYKIAFIPFAVGFISGHIFWDAKKETTNHVRSILIGLIIGVVFSIVNIFLSAEPIVYILIGLPLGHFIWPQKR